MRKARLLLVEDDAGSRMALAELLDDEGYEVHTAENGREGLDRHRETRPQLLLVDYALPDMTGLELIANIRATGSAPPFILITGSAELTMTDPENLSFNDHRDQANAMGAHAHMTKPINLDVLLTCIRTALAR